MTAPASMSTPPEASAQASASGSSAAPSALRIAVVGHTNAGKTSLLRTLTRRAAFGEVSDRPGVTRHVERIDLPEGSNGHQVIDELAAKAKFDGATEIITIDGLRVEFPDGFGLMRASNTTPILVLRFEADSDEAIGRIQNQFKAVIESNPALKWPL